MGLHQFEGFFFCCSKMKRILNLVIHPGCRECNEASKHFVFLQEIAPQTLQQTVLSTPAASYRNACCAGLLGD